MRIAKLTGETIIECECGSRDYDRLCEDNCEVSSLVKRAIREGISLRDAELRDTDLSNINFGEADLRGADLRDADLLYADLSMAQIEGALLSGVDLEHTNLPGFPGIAPASFNEAVDRVKKWLGAGHWVQDKWIDTPTGAYAGDCLACLHGAAKYVGGVFGQDISEKLIDRGCTVIWNDEAQRTLKDVLDALEAVKE